MLETQPAAAPQPVAAPPAPPAPTPTVLELKAEQPPERKIPYGSKFDPNTGVPIPKFDPNTGVQNWD